MRRKLLRRSDLLREIARHSPLLEGPPGDRRPFLYLVNSRRPSERDSRTSRNATDLQPEHERHRAPLDLGRGVHPRRRRVGGVHPEPLRLQHEPGRHGEAARALRPRAPRGRPRHRLPLLPFLRREERLGRHPADGDLHQLPQAHLERQPDARARPRELPDRKAAELEEGLRPARLRVLRPQHPRGEGSRLCVLPRPRRQDAPHGAVPVAPDGVVHRLPPQPGEIPAPEGQDLRPDVGRGRPGDARTGAREGEPAPIRPSRSRTAARATDEDARRPRFLAQPRGVRRDARVRRRARPRVPAASPPSGTRA